MALPFGLPPLAAVLLRPRSEALAALAAAGWRLWVSPPGLDAEGRRRLNLDLGEPDASAPDPQGGVAAVARLEVDFDGLVTVLEITGAAPVPARALADALIPGAGDARMGGGAEAREWVWGPEAGHGAEVSGEPVRLWVCAERSYGDRLWAVASVVRRASDPDED
ncbi:MAG TPA: hypothetical protein VH880_09715 [Anaeromyxobacteraceae bacterium]|jgi:hypothetical protein